MNKGGYSTPPQYRSGDYRYPPGPSRYQPYHPPPDRVYDSRQRPVMQNDYYPEVNYPSPRQGRPEMPPSRDEISFSRGRGREREFNGQYNRPSPPGPPPISPQFSRDYPHRFPHPPPFNINNPPNTPNNNNNPMPNTPPNTPPSNNNNNNNNNNHNNNANSNNNNVPHNNHPNYNSPRERPPDFPVRDFHSYRQESPVKPPPSPSPLVKQNPPPNSPNLNYPENFPPRMIPPESNRIPNIPPQFHRSNDYPPMNPIDDLSNLPPQFPINSPPRPPIHLMALKPNIPLPPNFHHPLNMPNPVPLNVEIETKLDNDDFRNYVQEVDLDMKKYYYDRACRKIDVVQAKLDAIVNKLSELEAESANTSLSSSSSSL